MNNEQQRERLLREQLKNSAKEKEGEKKEDETEIRTQNN